MASIQEYRQEQIQKLEKLTKLGINPYPAVSHRDTPIYRINSNFEELLGEIVTVAGRVFSVRQHGQLSFIDLSDQNGAIQIILKSDNLKADSAQNILGYDDLSLLTRGDLIEVKGKITKSKTGQESVEAAALRLLTKVLRPLPDQLDDKESRLRRRYLDMAINNEVRNRFERRAKFWQATREFLNHRGFVEVNIPVLEHSTGGADAKPFVTRMDALDQDFYLRISHELPLKRLIGGGFEKVYDIGPRFRNEHVTEEHLPEHVAMEWYWAYANWEDGMELMEKLYIQVAKEVWGKTKFKSGEHEFDLSDKWERINYSAAIQDKFGIDVSNTSIAEVKKVLTDNKIETSKLDNLPRMIDKLWKEVRKTISGPAWLIDVPRFLSPLAKSQPDNPELTQRFQPIFAGSEMGNGFSELNDPQEQLARFTEQQQMRDEGDDEAMMLDIDFIEMLEYGMPPTCGWGHSERVFWALEGVTAREGVPFPQLRHELNANTKEIYKDTL